jgi:hypothetical protein
MEIEAILKDLITPLRVSQFVSEQEQRSWDVMHPFE